MARVGRPHQVQVQPGQEGVVFRMESFNWLPQSRLTDLAPPIRHRALSTSMASVIALRHSLPAFVTVKPRPDCVTHVWGGWDFMGFSQSYRRSFGCDRCGHPHCG